MDLIEGIYQKYPRKVGKQEALKQIKAAAKRPDVIAAAASAGLPPTAWLNERADMYSMLVAENKTEEKFIVYPERWFKNGRYFDAELEKFIQGDPA